MNYTQDQLKQMHNGLISCPIDWVEDLMPEVAPLIETAPIEHRDYVVDVKVHMLMPNQFPCIPNWHGDFVPRDADNNLREELIDDTQVMFLWLSGPPITEFEDGRTVSPGEWVPFTQRDIHRGRMSDEFQWRLFVRLTPLSLARNVAKTKKDALRRHTQVYLDSEGFTW